MGGVMKKSFLVISLFSIFLFFSCEKEAAQRLEIDAESVKALFNKKISIEPMDDVKISGNKITLSPHSEGTTYTISGYFDGQITVNTKNTILKLKDAYLENSSGKEAVIAKAKTEISTGKDSTNYIVSRGRGFSKKAALEAKRTLVFGGSGTLFVKGSVCHAVEAEDVKIKGSGVFYFEGTKRGSALTCQSLEVEKDKNFSAFFLNSKNGIKADQSILINSGNFHVYSNKFAFKTDTKDNAPKKTHSIKLLGGFFDLAENESDFLTDELIRN